MQSTATNSKERAEGLKPKLIALLVLGAPAFAFAGGGFQPLSEDSMGNITGQAGVTIELETKVNIDRFIYTDEGSLEVNNIFIGGAITALICFQKLA